MSNENRVLWPVDLPVHIQEGLRDVQEQNARAIFNRQVREARRQEQEEWAQRQKERKRSGEMSKKEKELKALQHFKKGPNRKYPKWPSGSGRTMRYLLPHPYR